jgi:hypothetical protein
MNLFILEMLGFSKIKIKILKEQKFCEGKWKIFLEYFIFGMKSSK